MTFIHTPCTTELRKNILSLFNSIINNKVTADCKDLVITHRPLITDH